MAVPRTVRGSRRERLATLSKRKKSSKGRFMKMENRFARPLPSAVSPNIPVELSLGPNISQIKPF